MNRNPSAIILHPSVSRSPSHIHQLRPLSRNKELYFYKGKCYDHSSSWPIHHSSLYYASMLHTTYLLSYWTFESPMQIFIFVKSFIKYVIFNLLWSLSGIKSYNTAKWNIEGIWVKTIVNQYTKRPETAAIVDLIKKESALMRKISFDIFPAVIIYIYIYVCVCVCVCTGVCVFKYL